MTALADGIHPVVSRERYDAIERVNFSTLKLLEKSPAHYRHGLITPPADTDPKKLGRVVHIAAFEPERFRNAIAVWDGGTRRGKDWEAFKARNEGRELLTEHEYERCMAIQAAVRAKASAARYLQGGGGEVSLLWTATAPESGKEIPAKGRIDFDTDTALVDLKTTRCAKPGVFERQAFGLQYHAQAAWYVDGYFCATGKRKPYVVVAVESDPPHAVQVYRVPDSHLELGRVAYGGWLDQLVFCRENNLWPEYTNDMELELQLPPWMAEGDVDGLGLDFGEGD